MMQNSEGCGLLLILKSDFIRIGFIECTRQKYIPKILLNSEELFPTFCKILWDLVGFCTVEAQS